MRLSKLQIYILFKCLEKKNGVEFKVEFYNFYSKKEIAEEKKIIQDTIHKSLDSLVAKGLVVAYGHKTAKKWFIKKVKLTSHGRQQAKELIKKRQRKLPIK